MAKAIFKPLSFSTTIRNPHRIADFLYCIKDYEGKILTNEVIFDIIKNVLKNKIYVTMPEKANPIFNKIYSGSETFSDDQLNEIIKISPQKHKEAGFDYGWPSRFDTWYNLLKEFGFIDYSMNQTIKLTDAGKLMTRAVVSAPTSYDSWKYDEEIIQSAMLNALCKYQIDNPFCKNLNHNRPLILLLNLINKLKQRIPNYYNGISRGEISILICWPDSNVDNLAEYIINLRKNGSLHYSDEQIYDCCLRLLGATHEQEKRFKISQITGEAVDEYIRKMRITGVISLRGNGNYIDVNTLESKKIDYILNNYPDIQDFTFLSIEEYINYMGTLDPNLVNIESCHEDLTSLKQNALESMANEYSYDKLYEELEICGNKQASHDNILRLIDKPTRYELLISILLCKKFGKYTVCPNYNVDDEGMPTHTAKGGVPDIICEDDENISLIEVSLMRGRNEQINNEIIPIMRHLKEYTNPNNKKKTAIFISPQVHTDTEKAAGFSRLIDKLNVYTSSTENITEIVKNSNSIHELISKINNANVQINSI